MSENASAFAHACVALLERIHRDVTHINVPEEADETLQELIDTLGVATLAARRLSAEIGVDFTIADSPAPETPS